ncbi:hypothetical protein IE81DRAFT_182265 [Ceraceosorus guamensis]|uniref:Galactose oxidase n=1 Tax=Ceraceosorus guamensis TaxID=1522189 RepID=A0A316VXY0_9BASI|nr:hypothetical protein IE81DRAFT_182265 [Ceraceosorus guamensis]PWN41253.1 hypothetical protein IE81DRAFT_182265 [Ceraceosorus guamensis]
MHAPLATLAVHWHGCRGELPPPLVGASVTLVDSGPGSGEAGKVYLFGGRLVSTRRMVNTLYELDLSTLQWSSIEGFGRTGTLNGHGSESSAPQAGPSSSPELATSSSSGRAPQPRYFHSTDLWEDRLVVFGGMGYAQGAAASAKGTSGAPNGTSDPKSPKADGSQSDALCVLDEIIAFDLKAREWDFEFAAQPAMRPSTPSTRPPTPVPRYAHLSALTSDFLVIIGGQNMSNQYVEEINVFDLRVKRWIITHHFPRQCGSYRSLAVVGRSAVQEAQLRGDERQSHRASAPYGKGREGDAVAATGDDGPSMAGSSIVSPTDTRSSRSGSAVGAATSARTPQSFGSSPPTTATGSLDRSGMLASSSSNGAALDLLPMSVEPRNEHGLSLPLPLFIYTNYNFTDVKRELEVVNLRRMESGNSMAPGSSSQSGLSDATTGLSASTALKVEDRSKDMAGASLPPGLRFPTGAMLGSHLIISGTYLANTSQTFSIWALHVPTMQWTRLDMGNVLSTGSWNRAVLWPSKNKLIVFGNRARDLVQDYNHRQTNWDHVLLLNLESWGISQPPARPMSDEAMQMGLDSLTAATAGSFAYGLEGGAKSLSESTSERIVPPLMSLALNGRGDFEIVCADGIRLGCHRVILEKRWSWFAAKMREYRRQARHAARAQSSSRRERSIATHSEESAGNSSRPSLSSIISTGTIRALLDSDEEGNDSGESGGTHHGFLPGKHAEAGRSKQSAGAEAARSDPEGSSRNEITPWGSSDPRLTPRLLHLNEPSPVVLALLQFFYARCICTPLQRHPGMIASLLIIASAYHMADLDAWARHAAHVALNRQLVPPAGSSNVSSPTVAYREREDIPTHERHRYAVALYETAALCGHEALQIKALRNIMSISKWANRTSQGSNTARNSIQGDEAASAAALASTASGSTREQLAAVGRLDSRSGSVGSSQAPYSPARTPGGRTSISQQLATSRPSAHSASSTPLAEADTDPLDAEHYELADEGRSGPLTRRRGLSKAERMLGISNSSAKAERMLGISSMEASAAGLHESPSRTGTPNNVGAGARGLNHDSSAQLAGSNASGQRRPSNAPSASNQAFMLSSRTPSGGAASVSTQPNAPSAAGPASARKRFSLFGSSRSTSESNASSSTSTVNAQRANAQGYEHDEGVASRSSLERLQLERPSHLRAELERAHSGGEVSVRSGRSASNASGAASPHFIDSQQSPSPTSPTLRSGFPRSGAGAGAGGLVAKGAGQSANAAASSLSLGGTASQHHDGNGSYASAQGHQYLADKRTNMSTHLAPIRGRPSPAGSPQPQAQPQPFFAGASPAMASTTGGRPRADSSAAMTQNDRDARYGRAAWQI